MLSAINLSLVSVADAIREDDDQAAATGAKLAEVLRLRRDPDNRTRWATTWGNKTDAGLARTVLSLIEESWTETARDIERVGSSEATRKTLRTRKP